MNRLSAFHVLSLTDNLFVNEGGMRRCYRHPDDPRLCVKVYRPSADVPDSARAKRWRIWLGRRSLRHNINYQEYQFWQSLVSDPVYGARLSRYFPEMMGMTDTNMGSGLVEELLVNHDGTPVRNLASLRDTLTPRDWQDVTQQLQALADPIVRHAIPFYDWNPQNFLLQQQADGSYHVKVADLEGEFSNKELIKISRFSETVRRHKLKRRSNRFFTYLNGLAPSMRYA